MDSNWEEPNDPNYFPQIFLDESNQTFQSPQANHETSQLYNSLMQLKKLQ